MLIIGSLYKIIYKKLNPKISFFFCDKFDPLTGYQSYLDKTEYVRNEDIVIVLSKIPYKSMEENVNLYKVLYKNKIKYFFHHLEKIDMVKL